MFCYLYAAGLCFCIGFMYLSFLCISRFTDQNLNDLFCVLNAAAAVDGSAAVVLSDGHHHYHHQQQIQQNFYSGSYSQQQLTRLQDEILQCLETLERETLIFNDNEFISNSASRVLDDSMHPTFSGDNNKKNQLKYSEQQQSRRQLLVQRFLCPLFDQLLKFCRFVCPPLPPTTPIPISPTGNNGDDQQQLSNGGITVDHFHHHNKVCITDGINWLFYLFDKF